MTGRYKVIKTDIVPEITTVRLYDETVEHVKDKHPEVPAELPSITFAVTNAVQNPSHVERSYKNSVVFVDKNSTNAGGDPLRVPVKHIEGTSGLVKTFFFASTEDEPDIIWQRPDEQD